MFKLPNRRIPPRGWIVYGHDIFMAGLSFPLALYLRLGDAVWTLPVDVMMIAGGFFTLAAAVVFYVAGLYRGVWRYASINDLLTITKAVSLAVLIFLLAMFIWVRLEDFPRSVFAIQWILLIGMLGGPRFVHRILKDRAASVPSEGANEGRIPVLLAGAGDEAELFIRALAATDHPEYRVVGLLSERPGRVGQYIRGIEVVGTVHDLAAATARFAGTPDQPRRVVLTRPSMDGSVVRDLLSEADRLGLSLARLPKMTDFKDGITDKLDLRPVAIEDLLGRPQTPLDRAAMAALIGGREVLITGAGGSIGAELARQICQFSPQGIVLLDLSEFALYEIDMELARSFPAIPRRAVMADVRNTDQMARVFADVAPELVFHAAARKHVPLVEDNMAEGLDTNAIGTFCVARAARDAGAKAMVMISTDKAVNPTSVMGASKRLAEIVCQAMDVESRQKASGRGTRFVTVRFGNVLGSTGSVVPLFQKQLAEGGPLTVTDPEMTRYFMTIREAVELVLSASALGVKSDADGRIFVLDMGKPVKIVDLARQMIRLAGLIPDQDVKIEFTGIRPGEKLYEEIFHGDEAPVPTMQPGVLLATPRLVTLDEVEAAFRRLADACRRGDLAAAAAIVAALVPEFTGTIATPPPQEKKAEQA
ncbi:nucleoside-diphosphate sugar epimerase/dehydratase [Thalassospiraceae bacterium LMO-SO8]|nr:polysaccharide biosynthesis protein [Alphaproteobacteria bacterium LMO-S08]WND77612.1 nucleoside-diphosphate sugar epimerase/dehydratase [Thalassospiraceae bacterium LMO-SO8]